ncbi:MAG: carboxypeptidase-like regulatory domain-containing protein [Planctomycetota bacterium]
MPMTRTTQPGRRAPKDTQSGRRCWVPVRDRTGEPARASGHGIEARAGRAGALALLVLAAALGLLFVLLRSPGDGGSAPAADAADPARTAPVEERTDGAALDGPAADREPSGFAAQGPGVDVRDVGSYAKVERSFDGRGTVAGSVTTVDGSIPPAWTVHFEPSKLTRDGSHAVARTVRAEAGAADFYERDLPMGAYRVWAVAEGYRSNVSEIVLFRIAGDDLGRGLDHVHVDLKLRRMADVSGSVVDADAGVADGLDVHLVPMGRGERRTLTTDSVGRFRFETVPAGRWELRVGHPTHPVVEAVPVDVKEDSIELDAVQLPVLARLDLFVVDEFARPYPNVEVKGYLKGRTASALRGRTGPQGHFEVRYVVPGRWRIETEVPDEPGDVGGRYDYDIEATRDLQRIEMVIRERR